MMAKRALGMKRAPAIDAESSFGLRDARLELRAGPAAGPLPASGPVHEAVVADGLAFVEPAAPFLAFNVLALGVSLRDGVARGGVVIRRRHGCGLAARHGGVRLHENWLRLLLVAPDAGGIPRCNMRLRGRK